MDEKKVEKIKDLDFNIRQLKSVVAVLKEKRPDDKDPFFGTIGSFEQFPKDLKLGVAALCEEYQKKLETELSAM